MKLNRLTDSERTTFEMAKIVLIKAFILEKPPGFGEVKTDDSLIILHLPINSEGRPLQESVKSAPILVELQRYYTDAVTITELKGRELLPKEKLPILFKAALKKVNLKIKAENNRDHSHIKTVDPKILEEFAADDPERIFKRPKK